MDVAQLDENPLHFSRLNQPELPWVHVQREPLHAPAGHNPVTSHKALLPVCNAPDDVLCALVLSRLWNVDATSGDGGRWLGLHQRHAPEGSKPCAWVHVGNCHVGRV